MMDDLILDLNNLNFSDKKTGINAQISGILYEKQVYNICSKLNWKE